MSLLELKAVFNIHSQFWDEFCLYFYFLSFLVFIKRIVTIFFFFLFFYFFAQESRVTVEVVRTLLILTFCGKYLGQETRAGDSRGTHLNTSQTPVMHWKKVFGLEHGSPVWSSPSCWKEAVKGPCIP